MKSHTIPFQPQRGCARRAAGATPLGLKINLMRPQTQGSPPPADNPGLEGATPLALNSPFVASSTNAAIRQGLLEFRLALSRDARSSQWSGTGALHR
jgi:hypothetical protein